MIKSLNNYAYVNARLRARLTLRLPNEVLEELITKVSVDEAVLLLKDTFYEPCLIAYQTHGDLMAVEQAMNRREVELFTNLSLGLPAEVAHFLKALILRVEINFLKMIFRLWFGRRIKQRSVSFSFGEIENIFIVHHIHYDQLLATSTWEALIAELKDTPYAQLIMDNRSLMVQQNSIYILEVALDQYQQHRLQMAVDNLSGLDKSIAHRFLGGFIDLENILCGMRLKQQKMTDAAMDAFFIKGGRRLSREQWYQVLKDPKALVTVLSQWYPHLQVKDREPKTLVDQARALQLAEDGQAALSVYPFSCGSIIAYFFLMNNDIRKVLTALHSRHYKLSLEQTRDLL
jgi:vacuolar-type H+-ATPase subunit C/Vma6